MEWDFFSAMSGLTPIHYFTLSDHKYAYYRNITSITGSISLRDLEREFFKSRGAVGNSYSELAYDLYSRIGFSLTPGSYGAGEYGAGIYGGSV